MKYTILALLLLFTASCESLWYNKENRDFLVGAGADLAVAVVVSGNPEIEPYARAMAEVVRTKSLNPDTLDDALDLFVDTQVDEDDADKVRLVVDVIKHQYRLYFETRRVPIEPEVAAEAIADQLDGGSSK